MVYLLLPKGVNEGPSLIFYKALKRIIYPFIRDTLSPELIIMYLLTDPAPQWEHLKIYPSQE
ncbi:MAG TPA: hypothetical protein VIJ75_17090 [Hanamia sp.]